MDSTGPKNRIRLTDLAPRDTETNDAGLQQTLQRLGAPVGAPCDATCDCRIGLVCRDGQCAEDW